MRIGVIGCGTISRIYLKNLANFPGTELVMVSDLDGERARRRSEEFGVPWAESPEACLASNDVDLIVNLTIPEAHAEVSLAALSAGKHVYSEKPLAMNTVQGREILEMAQQKGLMAGAAPDTFMGAGLQKCRELIDAGAIGRPVSFTGTMLSRGPERWHPNPFIFYRQGAGPLYDLGPYYLTAIVALLGSVAQVSSMTSKNFSHRVAGHRDIQGQHIPVEIPTHVMAHLALESGLIGALTTSFDVAFTEIPRLEIYGTEGTLSCPDPNTFGGPVRLRTIGEDEWQDIPIFSTYSVNSRGLGVWDMVESIERGWETRANGQQAYHVLEIMEGILTAGETKQQVTIESRAKRPRAGVPV